MRARVKALSREVGQAKRAGEERRADELAAESRRIGDEEREAGREAEEAQHAVREALLGLPNLPSEEAPDGAGPEDNVELRRWWPGIDDGAPEPLVAEHQRVPHWEIGEQWACSTWSGGPGSRAPCSPSTGESALASSVR